MATRKLVFPHYSNRTYRSGFIRLSCYGSKWDEVANEEDLKAVLDDTVKNTTRKYNEHIAMGTSESFLKQIWENFDKQQKANIGTHEKKCMIILPLPNAITENTTITWNSSPSNFIEGVYGKMKQSTNLLSTVSGLVDMLKTFGSGGQLVGNFADFVRDALGVGTNNKILELALTGDTSVSEAIAQSPWALHNKNPTNTANKLLSLSSDASLMDYHKEAAIMNGARQIIFDPGYWQSFQGVEPRTFTFTWEIIPEDHEDALTGLEVCSRLREFSLPQSVSGVELASPHYWQINFSNKMMDVQMMMNDLVITNIQVDYSRTAGEWHQSGTPKMFTISITMQEVKSPTSDVYKHGFEAFQLSKSVS